MDDSTKQDSDHLTGIEIANLLNEVVDPEFLARATQHLGECQYCQTRLENCASTADDWEKFTTVMDSVNRHQVDTPQDAQSCANETDRPNEMADKAKALPLNHIAIVVFFLILVTGSIARLPNLIGLWRAESPPSPPEVPPVPSVPTGPPVAPVPEVSGDGEP